ncbi:hypothetical protein ACLMJK_008732 [Lecanora helva]
MSPISKISLLLGSQALASAIGRPCFDQVSLETTACSLVTPSGFWQIYQQTDQRSTNLFPFSPNGSAEFAVSQGSGGTNKLDLIVSFTNVPCPPAGRGPYNIQFLYSNSTRAGYSGTGNPTIDVKAITAPLPKNKVGDTVIPYPTWENMEDKTGSLIGTFRLPSTSNGEDPTKTKLFFINSSTCQSTINLRFGVTSSSTAAGSVVYYQNYDKDFFVPGLQISYNC